MSPKNQQDAYFFRSNQKLLPAGPLRAAEAAAVPKRQDAYRKAILTARDLKDALVACQQLDKTGNFDGGLDHVLTTWDRARAALEALRIQGITFLAEFDPIDDEDAA